MAKIARDYGYTLAELRKLQDDQVMSTLRVELFFDDEAGSWRSASSLTNKTLP